MSKKVFVTGGNGFLALHLIQQLLAQDYEVVTSVRQLDKQHEVLETLSQQHVSNLSQLSFVQADLTHDDNWENAFRGIDTIFSVASPVFVNGSISPEKTVNIATEGTQRIMRAAEAAGVHRMIMTANFGAVGFSNLDQQRITTEQDWTKLDQPGLSLYERSKLVAEKQAWQFAHSDGHQLTLTSINAGAMLGPALNAHISGSFGLVKNLLNGNMNRVPNIDVAVVDVRDVAAMHLLAMQTPAAADQRFIAVADKEISLPQMAELIRTNRPHLAATLPTKQIPDWLLSFAAHFNQNAREGHLMQAISHRVSNEQAKQVLDWQPQYSAVDAVLAATDTLVKNDLIKGQ